MYLRLVAKLLTCSDLSLVTKLLTRSVKYAFEICSPPPIRSIPRNWVEIERKVEEHLHALHARDGDRANKQASGAVGRRKALLRGPSGEQEAPAAIAAVVVKRSPASLLPARRPTTPSSSFGIKVCQIDARGRQTFPIT
jgi:hypothetical protein